MEKKSDIRLEVESLSVRRGARTVFRDICFTLGAGDALLVQGQNGSGKSSLLRAVAGLLPCNGHVLWQEHPIRNINQPSPLHPHYIGHLDGLKEELTGDEMIRFWQALFQKNATTFEDMFAIDLFRYRPIRHLSAGQRRRISLSRLGIHKTPLWLLDEPTTALDDETHRLLLHQIARHRAGGGMVLIASHQALDLQDARILQMKGQTA